MRFGFAIRKGGDPEIANALESGIDRGTRTALAKQSSDAVRRVAMMRHTPEEWAAMTVQARYDYGQDPPSPRWAERLLVGWALVCMGASWLYHLQDRLFDRRTL